MTIFFLFILFFTPLAHAQELGPVGPQKAPILDAPPPESAEKSKVPLPYKPKPAAPKSEVSPPEITPPPKVERNIPIIPSKYPEILGAPDPEPVA